MRRFRTPRSGGDDRIFRWSSDGAPPAGE